MRRKEALFAVIGGVVGAVLVMVVGLIAPIGAQTEVTDAEFGTITCRRLLVTSGGRGKTEIEPVYIAIGDGETARTFLTAYSVGLYRDWEPRISLENKEQGGKITVKQKDGDRRAVTLGIAEHGGYVSVQGKAISGRAYLAIDEHGGYISANGETGRRAHMTIGEHGGRVGVGGNGSSKGEAVMAVNEYGNGVVSTWDKNGYRLASLK